MNKKSWNPKNLSVEQVVQPILERLPVVSFYAKTRGWPFIIAWMHRITGVLLSLYFCIHIYTLSFLATPAVYDAKMKLFGFFILSFLEWLLALPVIFHALNGGRLILYEAFGSRNDAFLIKWMFSLALIYVLLLGFLMILQDQSVSLTLFWFTIGGLSMGLVYPVALKLSSTNNIMTWKLHRITGVYLLLMIPAHLLYMHLQPAIAHEANAVTARMQNFSVKLLDITLVISVAYHAGYGLISICKDYVPSGHMQNGLAFSIVFVLVVFGWIGVKLTILI